MASSLSFRTLQLARDARDSFRNLGLQPEQRLKFRFLKSAAEGDLSKMLRSIKEGADPKSRDEDGSIFKKYSRSENSPLGSNALHLALLSNHESVVQYLTQQYRFLADEENSQKEKPLSNLIRSRKISLLSWNCLTTDGSVFEYSNSYGLTPLHSLAMKADAISYLQITIPKVKERSQNLKTALEQVIPTKALSDLVFSYLDLFNGQDKEGKTPLDFALINKNAAAVSFLKEETDLTLKSPLGKTLGEKVAEFETKIAKPKLKEPKKTKNWCVIS